MAATSLTLCTALLSNLATENGNIRRMSCAENVRSGQSLGLRRADLSQFTIRREKSSPRSCTLGVWALSSNDFKTGTNIEFDGAPWRVLEFLHVKPGKGAAFVRTKLKNYVTGSTVDKTFRAGEQVPEATVQKDMKQFSYMDGEQFVFMDMETYEEVRLSKSDVGEKTKFLTEGMECSVVTWKDRVIDMDLPVTVRLKVSQAFPGVKGDTAQGKLFYFDLNQFSFSETNLAPPGECRCMPESKGGSKLVTVETGAQVTVPLFVNQDDTIVIQTKDGSYISRA